MFEQIKEALGISEHNKFWKRYEKGIDYINRKNLITNTNKNWNFFIGNQWEGVKVADGVELPCVNIVKKIIKHKVATISQSNMVAHYSDTEGRDDLTELYSKCDMMFSEAWEMANEDLESWATTKEAAITGDGIQYFPDSDFKKMQRINNTSILYGDESESDIQKQPYIIVHQRLTVNDVREEARSNGLSEEEIAKIVPDRDVEWTVGNRSEVDEDGDSPTSKVTCVLHFEKKKGILHVAKATKTVVYEPEHPVSAHNEIGDTRSMKMYPFIKMSWEDFPNSARGVSDVEQLIPNQLEINKTLARRSMIIKLMAFPRLAYDSTLIANPEALQTVGTPIEVTSGGVESVGQAISFLNSAQISSEPQNYSNELLDITQELSGAGETASGNIDPTRVAASAIIEIKDQAALPLKEQVAKRQTFVEDFAKLILEIKSVFEPDGFTVQTEEVDFITGETRQIQKQITKEELDMLKPKIRIDTSQDTVWAKETEQNQLREMLDNRHITFEEYIFALPEHSNVPKGKLEKIIKRRKELQGQYAGQMSEEDIEQSAVAQWEAEDDNTEQTMQ